MFGVSVYPDQQARTLEVDVIVFTCRVFPRPMQCARMQPDPGEEFAFFTDSQQLSQINWTPSAEKREHAEFVWTQKRCFYRHKQLIVTQNRPTCVQFSQ